jgi:hypothetical protein
MLFVTDSVIGSSCFCFVRTAADGKTANSMHRLGSFHVPQVISWVLAGYSK